MAAVWLVAGCALLQPAQAPPEQGDPRIANLRFEPDGVVAGQPAVMSFYFEVPTADLQEAFLIERGISQFQFYRAFNPVSIDLRQYAGQVAGTAEVPVRWTSLGVRVLELYVVTQTGRSSNHLRGTLTVR
jgi:hypothetical protein